ncbi:MAG: FKBP-type peptidyl-prolyl cis-trans isomerase [Myxococcales bacterium]|nr:MAG: FKBP-type peptidyl-prolyl cis-trans isomerase [Myxococcales bacterium]
MRASVPVLMLVAAAMAGCNNTPPEPETTPRVRPAAVKDEFKIVDEAVGTGAEAQEGSAVKVHYTGKLKNGTQFDTSRDRGEPFEFTVGKGMVIPGWDKGVVGMKVGGKRKLIIPADLGYGDRGSPPKIPPKATLLFDIELLEVK